MTRTQLTCLALALAAALAAASPASAADAGDRWQLSFSGAYAESTASAGPEGAPGGGVMIAYRTSPRIGVALNVATTEFDEEADFDFFGTEIRSTAEMRVTPVLARLDFHLTPGRRAELYLGPVAGWASVGDVDLETRVRFPTAPGVVSRVSFGTDDPFVWGAHAGVDVRLGGAGSRSYLSAGVTWLDLPLEIELPPPHPAEDDNTVDVEPVSGDLDPLLVQVGYSLRF